MKNIENQSTQVRPDWLTKVKNGLLWLVSEHLIWIILLILIIFGTCVPGFISTVNFINILWASAPLGCMTLAMFYVMLSSGSDLSIESIFGFAPVFAVLVMTRWLPDTISPIMGVLIALITGALLGLINGLLSVKLKVNSFLITLATMLFWRGVLVYWIPEGIYFLPDAFLFLGKTRINNVFPVAIIVIIVLYVCGHIVATKTSLGKSVYAIGNNEKATYIAGINVDRIKLITFVISGFLATIGGLIEAGRISSVTSSLGQNQIMNVFAACILGGTNMSGGEGKVTGIFSAVLVITIIDNMLNLFGTDPAIRQMIFGFVLLMAILIASLQKRIMAYNRSLPH